MGGWRRTWRRIRLVLGALVATLLIVAAVAMALGQLLLPLVRNYPDRVARLLEDRLDQPVAIEAVRGEWQPSGPLLAVTGLRVGRGDDSLALSSASLKLDFGAWFKPTVNWLELRIADVDAELRRESDGSWRLVGLPGLGGSQAGAGPLSLPLAVQVKNATLVVDTGTDRLQLAVEALRVAEVGDGTRVGARVRRIPPAGRALTSTLPAVSVVLAMSAGGESVSLYLAGQQLDLARWAALAPVDSIRLDRGHGDVEAWLDWRGGRVQSTTVRLALADMQIASEARGVIAVPPLQGLLLARREAGGWRFQFARTAPEDSDAASRATLWWHPEADRGLRLLASAQRLDLARWSPWLALLPRMPEDLANWLLEAQVHGELDSLELRWRDRHDFRLDASFSQLGFAATGKLPAIDHVTATLRGDEQAIALALPEQALVVDFPKVFRQPMALDAIAGVVVARQLGGSWQFATPDLFLDGQGYSVTARGDLTIGGEHSSPRLDLAAVVHQADVPAAKLFWPVNIMPETARSWLDRALVGGKLVAARALVRGHVEDWPFDDGSGRFAAIAEIEDTTLDFDPDWPPATALDATLHFVGGGMLASAKQARVLGNPIALAEARIADFSDAKLVLHAEGGEHAAPLMDLLRASPVARAAADTLDKLALSGPAKVVFDLDLPLTSAVDAATVAGNVELDGVALVAKDWNLAIDDLTGTLGFDAHGLATKQLHGSYHGREAELELRIADAADDPKQLVEATMRGRFDAASLLAGRGLLQPLLAYLDGVAHFEIAVTTGVSKSSGTQQPTTHLRIRSDLAGMSLSLPEPLAKPAGEAMPLEVDLPLPLAGNSFAVSLGDTLAARLRPASAGSVLAADIALGGAAEPAARPEGLRIHGRVAQLEPGGWLKLLFSGDGATGALPATTSADAPLLDLEVAELLLASSSFADVGLVLGRDAATWKLAIAAKDLAGTISIPATDLGRRGITARFDRLYWPKAGTELSESDREDGLAPAAIPPLHFWVQDLRLGAAQLGDTRFESTPAAGGMRIEQFETHSHAVDIVARGSWMGGSGDGSTRMAIDLSSADLGNMLAAFGYPGLVAGGASLARIHGSWPGPPTAFSLANLTGTMSVQVEDGRIPDLEPGVGRLFGLFSLRELPRRLSLDFGDFFQSGFAFNTIEGSFTFTNGSARTDDLVIVAPSATIHIRGRTGLKTHDYDQYVYVIPRLGGALPVVGALAGGPLGAAAGLAVQGLLGRGLNQAAAARYHVTGPWADPEIVRLADAKVPQAATSQAAPAPVATVEPSHPASTATVD